MIEEPRALRLTAEPLPGLPEIEPGAPLGELIAGAAAHAGGDLDPGAIVVVAQKAVSKAEGRFRALASVTPSQRAVALARLLDKDPRLVELALEESTEIVRADRGVLITRTRQGHVCANAGIDSSNVPGEEVVTLLPEDPDASARRLRSELRSAGGAPAVIVSDSFGRPWRLGQCDVAIGCAGFLPLEDLRGSTDALGRELSATLPAVADEAAAAAGLVRTKAGREAAVVVRGLERYVSEEDGPGAAALLRPRELDLFP